MSEVLVFAPLARADSARSLLARACRGTGITARLELFGSSGALFQRMRARRSPPQPDVVLWHGPYAAHAAALDNLLQPYEPSTLPAAAAHDPGWRWVATEFHTWSVKGEPSVDGFQELSSVPRLALIDPERSEVGMFALVAALDATRQTDGDVERGWAWWTRRDQAGLSLALDSAEALGWVAQRKVSHALTLQSGASPLSGLAPVPHAIGLAAGARNPEPARQMVDWLVSQDALATDSVSAWQAATNGLHALLQAGPPTDIEWATRQYRAVRQRWAQSGFGAAPTGG